MNFYILVIIFVGISTGAKSCSVESESESRATFSVKIECIPRRNRTPRWFIENDVDDAVKNTKAQEHPKDPAPTPALTSDENQIPPATSNERPILATTSALKQMPATSSRDSIPAISSNTDPIPAASPDRNPTPAATSDGNQITSMSTCGRVPTHVLLKIPHCAICNVYFRYYNIYERHYATKHKDEKPYGCYFCDKRFKEKYDLQFHEQHYHAIQKEHLLNVQKRECVPTICIIPQCGAHFPDTTAFERHALEEHPMERLMPCGFCGKTFRLKNTYVRHINEKHTVDPYFKCGYCRKSFVRSDNKTDHENSCKSKTNLAAPKSGMEPRENYCHLCDIPFNYHTYYADHFRKNHPDVGLYACGLCHKAFSHKNTFAIHSEKEHGKISKTKVYANLMLCTCKYCGLEIRGIKNYQKHGIQQHPGQKMFQCPHCNHEFVQKYNLKRHMHTWHADDEIKKIITITARHCDVCGKDLEMTHSGFRTHVRRHDFFTKCPLCDKGFSNERRDALQRHIWKIHGRRKSWQ